MSRPITKNEIAELCDELGLSKEQKERILAGGEEE